MSKEELKNTLVGLFPDATFDDGAEWNTIFFEKENLYESMKLLKNQSGLDFNYMFCLTCIDWKTSLQMVYHLSSTLHRHELIVKSNLDPKNPNIDTLCSLWKTAELLEREVYEMFGVHFNHHPDLRLLILPDGWEGKNPLLKDFDDPINMIKL